MKPSATIKLGKAFGIDVLLHWSFFLLPILVLWLSIAQGDSLSVSAIWLVLLLIILGSVLLHEIGHGLAARSLGIPILDIMLTPICGLARLERPPDRPRDEILVALAGPVANAVFAVILAGLIWASGRSFATELDLIKIDMLLITFWVNLSLFVLNLLPIFPMDGGRILRACLASFMDNGKATLVAGRLGQIFALAAAVVGVVSWFFPLTIVGVFLILTAEQEIRNKNVYV